MWRFETDTKFQQKHQHEQKTNIIGGLVTFPFLDLDYTNCTEPSGYDVTHVSFLMASVQYVYHLTITRLVLS